MGTNHSTANPLAAFGQALQTFLEEVSCATNARQHITVLDHPSPDHRLSLRRFTHHWDGERVGFVTTTGHLVVEVSIPLGAGR